MYWMLIFIFQICWGNLHNSSLDNVSLREYVGDFSSIIGKFVGIFYFIARASFMQQQKIVLVLQRTKKRRRKKDT